MLMIIEHDLTRYEVAMRAWADTDPDMARRVSQVYRMRLALMTEIFRDLGFWSGFSCHGCSRPSPNECDTSRYSNHDQGRGRCRGAGAVLVFRPEGGRDHLYR